MGLPKINKCCFCIPLEIGCVISTVVSFSACVLAIAVCSWKLPEHRHQRNEDNIVLLSMTMFATLSAISNLTVLIGIALRRPSFLQLSLLSNAVFILCILMIAVVTCLFSPALRPHLQHPGGIVLVIFLLIAAAVYSFYYLAIVNSMYSKMKTNYSDSMIPV